MALPLPSSFLRISNGNVVLNAGDLTHRVDILQQGELMTPPVADAWASLYSNVPCAIETRTRPLPDTAVGIRSEFIGIGNLVVTMRHPRPNRPEIYPNMRLRRGSLIYIITLAENVFGQGHALVLTCQGLEGNV